MFELVKYVGSEIKYGVKLFVNGWKKLILHPIQTVKNLGYAIIHPIKTVKNLLREIKQHPIGMVVNFSLYWATGRVLSVGVDYISDYIGPHKVTATSTSLYSAELPNPSPSFNSSVPAYTSVPTHTSKAGISSVLGGVFQFVGGGCGCGGVCTIVQTAPATTSVSEQDVEATNAPKAGKCCGTSCTSNCASSSLALETTPLLGQQKEGGRFAPYFARFMQKGKDSYTITSAHVATSDQSYGSCTLDVSEGEHSKSGNMTIFKYC